ncbi:carboxy terminal-processing peptidase [Pseudoflavitalea sp. X16]|uniref:carboxy terminal-processing peptidase n=1 Tax=Paraflavitalea devenefica TaxID=2716334 RepID=UPI00142291B8|nr:carboxy terminal-processing peptidase [Paraflavitalea devenefica]NII28982.1 carboxy terminal-processing peptidase [Paraflavitalea devenefica]
MVKRKNLPVVLIILGAGLFLAFRTLGLGGGDKPPATKYEKILHNVGEMLSEIHYSPKKIDDNFSREVFKKFLVNRYVDENKNILLQSDVQRLKKYETKIDNELLGEPVQFVPEVSEIVKKRILETEQIYKEVLSKPFDFTKEETANFNTDEIDFPKNEAERKEVWRKRLKSLTLDRYADLLDARERNKGKDSVKVKTDAELEKEARDRVMKIMDRIYERLKVKINDDDRFNEYVKTITESMDPHTTYFPPVDKRYFDEQMSGSFFGIGASLREDEGGIKIGSLITGSPAWKSGEVAVGDMILKVGQGVAEPVDLGGFFVEDAVKVIRGKQGTEVRLTLKKADGSVKVISLIRDKIVQDETFARSAIVNTTGGKIGFIYLPEFYADFDNPKGPRCSEDVRKEIIKLKEQKVDGIVMDLRNNGGGSLYDVVQMVGLFIESGPIVQVKDRDGKPQIYPDRDKSILYDGPLAVMVNEFSASASEIFAAAIQDYDRGIIIGSTSTYGKGTVQRNIGLDKNLGMLNPNSELGTVKLTLQKFYRINGGSTQLRGVSSDIALPDLAEYSKLREKDNPDALPWDEIQKADYSRWKYGLDLAPIKKASDDRLKTSDAFTKIKFNAEWLAKQNDKVAQLNLKKYQEEQKQMKAVARQIDSLSKSAKELDVEAMAEDLKKFEYDAGKLERFKQWIKSLRGNDIYLGEAVNVVNDMIVQKNLVYNNNNNSRKN